jgi:NTP pyrophosphatase (non-canonical NTP hydrolase)
MKINEMVEQAHATSRSKGWWDEQQNSVNLGDGSVLPGEGLDPAKVERTIPEKLCLIHSEVSEALEDYRRGDMEPSVGEKGKPCGFTSELADILIRIGDLAGAMDIDLESAVIEKMAFNTTRSHRHGNKSC